MRNGHKRLSLSTGVLVVVVAIVDTSILAASDTVNLCERKRECDGRKKESTRISTNYKCGRLCYISRIVAASSHFILTPILSLGPINFVLSLSHFYFFNQSLFRIDKREKRQIKTERKRRREKTGQ